MELPQVRPGRVEEREPMPRILALFPNAAAANSTIQLLTALGVPNDRLGVTTPDRMVSGQGMLLAIPCPNEKLIPKIEAICRSQGAEVRRQRIAT
jgi:hypothetical protein